MKLGSSCTTKSNVEFVDAFDQKETLELQSTPIVLKQDNPFLSYMFEMKYSDSLLFVNEFPDPEYCMKIIDLRNNTIHNFAKKGKGPNEMQAQSCEFSVDYLNRNLYVTDHNVYYVYSIDSLLNNKYIPINKFSFRPEGVDFLKTTYCFNYIVGNAIKNRFALYNLNTNKYSGKYQYPNGPMVDQANFYSHPKKRIVAWFQSKSATMGLIHFENDSLTMTEYFSEISKNKATSDGKQSVAISQKNAKNGFIIASVSEKYIYSLYSGKIFDTSSMEKLKSAYLSDYVYVQDWEGKPVKRYKLDQEVRSIAIDEKNNILYAASYLGGEPHIVKYQLK